MWIRTFNKYTIKMDVFQSLGSRVWNWQLKLRKKYYEITLYYKRFVVTNLFNPSPQMFRSLYKCLSYFQRKEQPVVSFAISKHDKLLIDFMFSSRQYTLLNRGKKNGRISSNLLVCCIIVGILLTKFSVFFFFSTLFHSCKIWWRKVFCSLTNVIL